MTLGLIETTPLGKISEIQGALLPHMLLYFVSDFQRLFYFFEEALRVFKNRGARGDFLGIQPLLAEMTLAEAGIQGGVSGFSQLKLGEGRGT